MRLKSLMVLVLVLFTVIPVAIAGSFAYTQSYKRTYETCKQDLEERLDFCLRTCEFYQEKVKRGELTKQEAISEIADLLAGPLQPDGARDITKSIGKGKEGYPDAAYSNGTFAIHPYMEGVNIQDITDPEIRKVLEFKMKATSRKWLTYSWQNPGEEEKYLKIYVVDYFEPFDLHFVVNVVMNEFTHPLKVIRNSVIIAGIIAAAVGIEFSLFVGAEDC
jgi:hypothetical protein